MHCPKCLNQGEHKTFNTFEYWYCGQCRAEIVDAPGNIDPTWPSQLVEAYAIPGGKLADIRNGYTLKLPGSGAAWMHIPGTDVYESDIGTQWSDLALLSFFGAVPQ